MAAEIRGGPVLAIREGRVVFVLERATPNTGSYGGQMSVATKNWAGNQRCVPVEVHEPTSTDEVAAVVRAAAQAGERVKVIGGGHSFTDVAMTDGHLLSLDAMNRVLRVGGNEGFDVTVQAGIRLFELNDQLAKRGFGAPKSR